MRFAVVSSVERSFGESVYRRTTASCGEERAGVGSVGDNQSNVGGDKMSKSNFRVCVLSAVLFLCIGLGGACSVQAEEQKEDKPTATFSTDILSQYIFRGYGVSKDSAVIQPSVTLAYKGFFLEYLGKSRYG